MTSNVVEDIIEVDQEVIQEDYDDDDYANSIPMPVRSDVDPEEPYDDGDSSLDDGETGAGKEGSDENNNPSGTSTKMLDINGGTMEAGAADFDGETTDLYQNWAASSVHPNEEPPEPTDGEGDDLLSSSTIYEDTAKSSKFDMNPLDFEMKSSTEEAKQLESSADENHPGIKAMIQNLLGGNEEADKAKEETERARKWREWMVLGRKSRGSKPDEGEPSTASDVALDESLLSLKKGEDYVVVAVPAEAADGVGPILPSFPGGKSFQKGVKMAYQEMIVNGDNSKSGSNSTSSTIALKEKKEKKKKQSAKKTKDKQKDKKKHPLVKRRGEPGRISSIDWKNNIFNLPHSTILRDVTNPVKAVFLWSTLFSASSGETKHAREEEEDGSDKEEEGAAEGEPSTKKQKFAEEEEDEEDS